MQIHPPQSQQPPPPKPQPDPPAPVPKSEAEPHVRIEAAAEPKEPSSVNAKAEEALRILEMQRLQGLVHKQQSRTAPTLMPDAPVMSNAQ